VDPVLTVLFYSSIAAMFAAIGALPLLAFDRLPTRWMGWANALAAGLMLGSAYSLYAVGLDREPVAGAVGSLLGIAFTYWTHAVSRTADLDLNRLEKADPAYGYKVLFVNALHSASEGVAIGVAMTVHVPFGIFMAGAIAVHNIPEGTLLSAVVSSRGARLRDAAGRAVGVKVSQVLLSIVTVALVAAAPGTLPWARGFAVGALLYLVMVELLPESYRQAGHTSIAVLTSVAMCMLVLLKGMVV